jgi:excisionase family DNA binding protein
MSHELLTTSEVADLFRVNEATVGRWVREGKVTAVPLPGGKGYRYRRADIEALLSPEPGPGRAG